MVSLPAMDTAFRDLGMHQLHGLPAPSALFQVEVADLPVEFPPPRLGISDSAAPGARRPPGRGAREASDHSRRRL
jgi:hypothetical protein